MAKKDSKPTKTEDSNLLGALAYILGVLAIVLYLIKKDNKFVRFHSMQSVLFCVAWITIMIILSIPITIISIVTAGIGGILSICLLLIPLVVFVIVLYAIWKTYQGEMWHMPLIGDLAEKYA